MKREQMDMFDAAEPKTAPGGIQAQIIPFPIDRNLVFIRETARLLEKRQGPAADRFWKTTCNRLYGRLQVQGLAPADIRKEVDSFAHAVYAEMQKAAWAEWSNNNPRGAA